LNALGKHLLLELRDCNKEALDNIDFIRINLVTAAIAAGATVMGESFHKFSPQGVSGVVVISESHLTIHTWPEFGYAAVDVFTCGTSVKPEIAAQILVEKLGSKDHSMVVLERGILEKEQVIR
jgi:S-adenosylmethionine decarboxylase